MNILNYWGKCTKPEGSRVFIKYLDNTPLAKNIFLIPKGEQPIFVVDNIFSNENRHFVLESKKFNIEHLGKNIILTYDVALLDYKNEDSIKNTTILIDFFNQDNIKINDIKITRDIDYRKVKNVMCELKVPDNSQYIKIKIFVNKTNKIKSAYTGFIINKIGEQKNIEKKIFDSKLITMTLFNNFKNDTRVLREGKSLLELGFRVRILALWSKGQPEREVIEGIEVIRHKLTPWHLKLIRKSRTWLGGPFIESILRGILMPFHRYLMFLEYDKVVYSRYLEDFSDVYHAHDLNTLRVAEKLSKAQKSKLVYDSHELYLDRNRHKRAGLIKRFLLKSFEKGKIRKCDAIITVNDSIANILCKRYNIEDVNIITNTPPIQLIEKYNPKYDLRKILSIKKDMKLLIYVGSIQRNRGIENLIMSLKYLDNVYLVLMGYGNKDLMDELDTLVESNNLADRYSIFGPVPSELVPRFTSSADIGAAPILNSCLSYYLCSPNKIYEYIHAGIPVIASDFPELSKVVLGNKIGKVFDPDDPEDIANSLKSLLKDKDLENIISDNIERSSRIYNWNNESRKLQDIYINLFNNEDIIRHDQVEQTYNSIELEFLNPWMEKNISSLEIENLMPGEKSWGVPKNKESSEIFNCYLNSNIFNKEDTINVYMECDEDLEIICKIYRIGYYDGNIGRKLYQKNGIIVNGNSDINMSKKEILSLDIDENFYPGTYVVKVISNDKMTILPFWIHSIGKILALVPTIGNKINDYPRNSDLKKSLYSKNYGNDELFNDVIQLVGPFRNSRGGSFSQWVVPFCSWSENNDLDVSWVTDVYLDKNPQLIKKYDKVVLLGDSRFWTKGLHKIIGEHIATGGMIVNLGSGMGEQLVKINKEHNVIIEIPKDGSLTDKSVLNGRMNSKSPILFGGRTDSFLPLKINTFSKDTTIKMIGSWDTFNETLQGINKKDIFTFNGESGIGKKIKIVSSELQLESGGLIFHSSIENWGRVLMDDTEGDFVIEREEMRKYIYKLLNNGEKVNKDPIKIRRKAIEYLIGENWSGKVIPKNKLKQIIKEKKNKKINKICFLSAIWERPELTEVFLQYLKILEDKIPDIEIECVIVGSEGEVTQNLVEGFGFFYVEAENYPLSKKWNKGLKFTEKIDSDAVIIIGSDDFLSIGTIIQLCDAIRAGSLMVGLMDMHIFNTKNNNLYHWKGYKNKQPNRQWETIGMARCISRKLLQKVNYSLWDEEDINRGLDGLMTRKIAKIGLLTIPYGEEVWMNIDNEAYACGHVGLHTNDFSGFAVDVKTNENITNLERYSVNKNNYEDIEKMKEQLGEITTNDIMRIKYEK